MVAIRPLDAPEITYRTSTLAMTIDEELAHRQALEAIAAIQPIGCQPRPTTFDASMF